MQWSLSSSKREQKPSKQTRFQTERDALLCPTQIPADPQKERWEEDTWTDIMRRISSLYSEYINLHYDTDWGIPRSLFLAVFFFDFLFFIPTPPSSFFSVISCSVCCRLLSPLLGHYTERCQRREREENSLTQQTLLHHHPLSRSSITPSISSLPGERKRLIPTDTHSRETDRQTDSGCIIEIDSFYFFFSWRLTCIFDLYPSIIKVYSCSCILYAYPLVSSAVSMLLLHVY